MTKMGIGLKTPSANKTDRLNSSRQDATNTRLPLPYIWIHFDSMISKSHYHSLYHDKTCTVFFCLFCFLFPLCFGFSFRAIQICIIVIISLSVNCIKIQWKLTKFGLGWRSDLHLWNKKIIKKKNFYGNLMVVLNHVTCKDVNST